jgi:choline-sulfatase
MHFAPVHADHGFETMRLCEHLQAQGLGPLSRERGDEYDDYHYWLEEHGFGDWRGATEQPLAASSAAEAHPTAWVEREASALLDRRDRRRPLFLIVSFPHPHAPYDPPEPYASMFTPAESVLPTEGFEANRGLPLPFQLAAKWSKTRAEAESRQQIRNFLAAVRGLVRQIDDAIGRLLARIDLSTTVVFFTSDHGDYSGHRGFMRKDPWIPFDDLARVPLLAAGAGVAGGRRVTELVQSCDLPLTWLDFADVRAPDGLRFDSRSLRPCLGGKTAGDADRVVYSAISIGWPMVRHGKYKLIQHHAHGSPALFDLEADPHEQVNLARDDSHAAVRAELAGWLDAMRAEAVLEFPINVP